MITFYQHHDHAQATLHTLHRDAALQRALPRLSRHSALRSLAQRVIQGWRGLHQTRSSHA